MSATHQALYYRLRFNLGQYTTAASVEPAILPSPRKGFP